MNADDRARSGLSLQWRGNRLTCRVRGCTRLATLDAYLGQVADDCRRRPPDAVLVDLTATDDLVSTADRMRLGFRLAAAWPRAVPMAVLVRPEMHLPDRTFEHVAGHRGLRVRSFSDRRQAWHWLALQARRSACAAGFG
jgi:hypothetical protein